MRISHRLIHHPAQAETLALGQTSILQFAIIEYQRLTSGNLDEQLAIIKFAD